MMMLEVSRLEEDIGMMKTSLQLLEKDDVEESQVRPDDNSIKRKRITEQ